MEFFLLFRMVLYKLIVNNFVFFILSIKKFCYSGARSYILKLLRALFRMAIN